MGLLPKNFVQEKLLVLPGQLPLVTADRIRMINQLYNIQTQAEVVDFVDSESEACGIKAILEIPI